MTPLLDAFVSDHTTPPTIYDIYRAEITNPELVTVDGAFRAFFAGGPAWLGLVMWARNAIVRRFGFDVGVGSPSAIPEHPTPGDRIGAFTVIDRAEDEILFGSDDAHMDLRISLRVQGRELSIATTAFANDRIGRAYLALVKHPHKPIASLMTKRCATS